MASAAEAATIFSHDLVPSAAISASEGGGALEMPSAAEAAADAAAQLDEEDCDVNPFL